MLPALAVRRALAHRDRARDRTRRPGVEVLRRVKERRAQASGHRGGRAHEQPGRDRVHAGGSVRLPPQGDAPGRARGRGEARTVGRGRHHPHDRVPRSRGRRRPRRDRGQDARDGRDPQAHRTGRRDEHVRAHPRRARHRQGARGQGHPLQQQPPGQAVRGRELLGAPGRLARGGAVRGGRRGARARVRAVRACAPRARCSWTTSTRPAWRSRGAS